MEPNEVRPDHPKASLLQRIIEGKGHPVIVFAIFVGTLISGTVTATVFVLRSGIVPRSLYMPPKKIAELESSERNTPAASPPINDGSLTLRITPSARTTPDPAAVKKISAKGMEAVRFMLRFHSQTDAGKAAMGKTNNGKTIDWDLVVDINGGMSRGAALLDCSPPHIEHWTNGQRISMLVTVDPAFEALALSLENDELINVKAELDISDGSVYLQKAKIEQVKQPE